MTREELEADPRFVISDQIEREAKVLLSGKVVLHPTKFFEHSAEGREEIIRHEFGHLKVRSLLKDKGKQFWLISDSQLFGKYDAEKKEWIPIEGFYSVNLDETLANAISMYEINPVGFTKKFPQQTPIVKALSEGKPITPEMVEPLKEPWRMTKKEFLADPPEEADIWLVKGKPPHRGKIGSTPDFFGGPPTRGYRVANTVTPFGTAHKNIVKHALKEDKPVPQEVLRDYPDLTEKPATEHEKAQKPGEVYKGEAWRAESDLMVRGETAKDIVDFEAEELGNEDIRRQAKGLGIDLSAISARDVIWVTTTKEAAEHYSMGGEIPIERVDIPQNAIILATDYQDGYLVWINPIIKPKTFEQVEHVS